MTDIDSKKESVHHMDVKLELLYLKRAYENMKTLHEESSLFSPTEFKKIAQELGKKYKSDYDLISDDYLFVIQHKIEEDVYIADDITENYMTNDGDYLPLSFIEPLWYENDDCFLLPVRATMTLTQVDIHTDEEIETVKLKMRDERER